ncbi:heme-binding protein soul2 [Enoplosus armatus]|uniref:heme-binding protein soul2 n=1 Tax=Enoplosus armatus TaxID=215367 RepID=UPI003996926C
MERPLFLLVVLASSCRGLDWIHPDFCHRLECPQYKVVGTNQDFEERLYVATEWITTKVESTSSADLMAAHLRLKDYCRRQNDAGRAIPDSWPVLVTVTDGRDLSLSWFVAPNTMKAENADPSVTLQSRPEATVYVRVFNSAPSIESGEENAKTLQEALVKAGKTFDPDTYSAAGYDHILSFTHHNEIWIYTP